MMPRPDPSDADLNVLKAQPEAGSLMGTASDLVGSFMEHELSPSIDVGDVAEFGLEAAPITGQALAAEGAEEAAEEGNWPRFAVEAIGTLPALGGVTARKMKSLESAYEMLMRFAQGGAGKRLAATLGVDVLGKTADILNPKTVSKVDEYKKAITSLYADTHAGVDPEELWAMTRSQHGRFSGDPDVDVDVLTVLNDASTSLARAFNVPDSISPDMFREYITRSQLGEGDPNLMRLVDNINEQMLRAESPIEARDLEVVRDAVQEILEVSKDFTTPVMK